MAADSSLAAAAEAAADATTLAAAVADEQRISPRSVVQPMRAQIEDVVGAHIMVCDPRQELRSGDFQDVLFEVTDKVLRCMDREERSTLDDEDRDFIARRVLKMVNGFLQEYMAERCKPTRFRRAERVVCRLGGDRSWASGIVAASNQDNPEDPRGPKLPYVVKVDPPNSRLVSVPKDDYDLCRAEVCFGQRAGALWFTIFCMPSRPARGTRRFASGERVACAIEDESNDYSVWAAGTVRDVDYSIQEDAAALDPERDFTGARGVVPYRVELDTGGMVLVHRDEHWLVRDLELQSPGPRQLPAGESPRESFASSLTRLERRHKGDYTWESIDHQTRRRRPCEPPSDDEHSDGCDCGAH